MAPLTRQEFLKLMAAGSAGAAFAGVGADKALDAIVGDAEPAEAATLPLLSVVKAHSLTQAAAATKKAVDALGGIAKFVHRGSHVVIKPNICASLGAKYACTTNPTVVGELVALCKHAGAASIHVMDHSFHNGVTACYNNSGIAASVKRAGGAMVYMSDSRYKSYRVPGDSGFRSCAIWPEIMTCTCLIDVPVAKVHGSSILTIAGKNLMGCCKNMSAFHANLSGRIAAAAAVIRPDLTVVDATRILVRNGPVSSNLHDVSVKNTIIASRDIVAADAYAATLFGRKGTQIPYINAMYKQHLGQINLSKVKILRYNI